MPLYKNSKQCLGVIHLDVDGTLSDLQWVKLVHLKAAQNLGCTGFHTSGRIDSDIAFPFLREHKETIIGEAEESLEELKKESLRKDNILADIKIEKERGKYVLAEDVRSYIKTLATAQKALLRTLLTQDLPPKLKGLDTPQITKMMDEVVEEVCKEMREMKP